MALLALSGCGDLPHPFAGSPDRPRRLSQPPPARLAIAPPSDALLPDAAGAVFSGDVVGALVDREVPAVAGPARDGDWRLVVSAELRGDKVVPAYTVQNPKGEPKGTAQGHAVDAASWSAATDATLQQVASADAGSIASLLTSIEAARQRSDPNSLVNRPAKLFVKGVSGAPGDGDRSLARNLREQLTHDGAQLTDAAEDSDFSIEAKVRTDAGKPGVTRVEIQWIVTDAAGHERGRIIQLNDVPAQSVAEYWGDVAVAAATEAAGGVRRVVAQQSGAPQAEPSATPDSPPKPETPPPAS